MAGHWRAARWVAPVIVLAGCGWLGTFAVRTWRASSDVAAAQSLALTRSAAAAQPYVTLAAGYRPDRAEAWRLLAQFRAFAHPRQARQDALRAVAVDPDDWRNWRELGLIDYQLGEVAAARRALAQAVVRDSGWEAHYQLGNLALLLGRRQEFWAQMQAALAVVPPRQAGPVLNQAFSAARGAQAPWLAVQPVRRAAVEAVAVNVLLNRGEPMLAAESWRKVQCPRYQRSVCRQTALQLVNRLANLAFQGPRPTGESPGFAPPTFPAPVVLTRHAVEAWNTAVSRHWLDRAAVRPGAVNDGQFQHGWLGPAFGWVKAGPVYASVEPGMGPAGKSSAMRLDFTGYQPENTPLVRQFVPVRPGARYAISFLSRRLGQGSQTGVQLVIAASPRQVLLRLPAELATAWGQNTGGFRVPDGCALVQLSFDYARPLGQVRLRNAVLLADVRLQPLLP